MILIDSFPYDLMVSGELTLDSEITKQAVEEGSDVTDNIRKLPVSFTLTAIVSDTPIGEIANHETRRIDDVTEAVFGSDMVPLPSDEAYNRLFAIREEERLVTIEIPIATRSGKPGKRTFRKMGLEHLSIPFSVDTIGGLTFSASFSEVRIVVNKKLRIAVPAGLGTQKYGLSIDRLVNGSAVLWRKGRPPGRSPATDPPGVIYETETVHVLNGKILHADKKTPLTAAENTAFAADLNRDTAIMTNRGIARAEDHLNKIGDKADRALAFSRAKDIQSVNQKVVPGALVDPALFGLKPSGN